MSVQQLSVYIENHPGRLFAVTEALGAAGINIRGLSLQEGEVSGTLRLITSDVPAARNVLMSLDIPGTVEEVVAVRAMDNPGSLALILKPLYEAEVNLRYAYSFLVGGGAVIILQSADNDAAESVLVEAGFKLLTIAELLGGVDAL